MPNRTLVFLAVVIVIAIGMFFTGRYIIQHTSVKTTLTEKEKLKEEASIEKLNRDLEQQNKEDMAYRQWQKKFTELKQSSKNQWDIPDAPVYHAPQDTVLGSQSNNNTIFFGIFVFVVVCLLYALMRREQEYQELKRREESTFLGRINAIEKQSKSKKKDSNFLDKNPSDSEEKF